MTMHLRVPGLLDLMLTDDPSTITGLGKDPRLDRDFDRSGPLVNRAIFRSIRRILRAEEESIAGVAPRNDPERARRQRELQERLVRMLQEGDPAPEQTAALAAWVRADASATHPGQTAQEALGRLFRADFVGTPQTWRAARIIDTAPRAPIRRFFWRFMGEPERSRRLLSDSVGGDPAAMHGVAIAVRTLVRSLEAMRELWRDPGLRSLPPDIAAYRSLRAPRSVVRCWSARATTPKGDFRPGSMVVFNLDAASRRQPGDRLAFMAGTWSECPARQWTTTLLRAVWSQAGAGAPIGVATGADAPEDRRKGAS